MSRPHTKGRSKKSPTFNIDRQIARSMHTSAAGDIVSVPDDTERKLPSWNLIQRPPKNFLNMIHWLQESYEVFTAISSAGAVAEYNVAPTLTQFIAASNIAALFDQYCIYSISVRAMLDQVATAPGVGLSFGRIITAIDYDSNTNLNVEANLMKFGSVQVAELEQGKSYERFCKPAVSGVTGGSNSVSSSGVTTQRSWLNCNFQSVPHFGIRVMTNGNSNVGLQNVILVITAVIGVRNSI